MIRHYTLITCDTASDTARCESRLRVDTVEPHEARKVARESGWRLGTRTFTCPACVERRAA